MPLIRDGAEAENTFTFIEDGHDLPETGCLCVSVAKLKSDAETLLGRNQQIGVRLSPEDDPADLAEYLGRLALIEVSFPKYTDGRGYSQAQVLRRRYRYAGELRAVGHVLRDQILYMNRSGFDAYETARADLSSVLEALREFEAFYQPAADGTRAVFAARHAKD